MDNLKTIQFRNLDANYGFVSRLYFKNNGGISILLRINNIYSLIYNFLPLQLLNFPKNINVIIGNESCDLDSTVSALALAYFMNENGNKEDDSVTLPVLNVPKEEFMFRVENLYVLNKIGINTSSLYYKYTLNKYINLVL